MSIAKSHKVWAVAAAGVVALSPLATPVTASASPSGSGISASPYWVPNYPPPPHYPPPPPPPGYWYHPEWGPGWNNGYPGPGWVPPQNWGPPQGWTNPTGWEPPPGYLYPQWWCSGPWRQAWHLRCQ